MVRFFCRGDNGKFIFLEGTKEQDIDIGTIISPSILSSINLDEINENLADWCALAKESGKTNEALPSENYVMDEAVDHGNTLIDTVDKDGEFESKESDYQCLSTANSRLTSMTEFFMSNRSLFILLGSPKSRGTKRPFDHIENANEEEEESVVSNNPLALDFSALKKKCKKLVERVKEMESTYMRKSHPRTKNFSSIFRS